MIIAKKNAAYYLSFPAIDSVTPENYKTGLSPIDTAYYKDGSGSWTLLPITDTASEIGSTGVYEIDFTAGEMNHDKVFIKFSVSGMADDGYMFDMRVKLTDDLNDLSIAQVNTEVDTALDDYDGPTKTEMDSGHNLLATEAKQDIIDSNIDQIETAVITNAAGADISSDIIAMKAETVLIVADTDELQTDWINGGRLDLILDIVASDTTTDIPGLITALNNISTSEVATELATYDSPTKAEMDTGHGLLATGAKQDTIDLNIDAMLVDTDVTIPALIAALNDLSNSDVNTQVDTALSDYDGPTRSELTTDINSVLAKLLINENRLGFALSVLAGTISTAGTASEVFSVGLDGDTFTVTVAVDGVGNRSSSTLAKT